MDIQQVDLKQALVCAYLAKEVYYKFPDEIKLNPTINKELHFKNFSKFPSANVELHFSDKTDTQCAILQEPGSDHVYLIFRGTEKSMDWKTNVEFSRDLFQVRDKGKDKVAEETAVLPQDDDEDDSFSLPDDTSLDGEEETGMSFNEDDEDDGFSLPADEHTSDDEESDMHFEPVAESDAKHFEFANETGDKAPQYPRARMHLGFVTAYMSVQDYVHDYIVKHQPKKLTVTGHSLGGALATCCAIDMKLTYLSKYDIELYTFGAPRVGNEEFPELFNTALPKSYRFVNGLDIVPAVPRTWQGYRHVNHEIRIGKGLSWRFLSRRATDHFMVQYINTLEEMLSLE